ncbi:MAG: CBS domain-containing protein [Syntrophobacteraceae bacterium]|jgi:predicted transcriptional regulator|nr:CBS domain-containing protein [Syntrophobacteraceae bacterium]MCU0586670.1 CBS domain-containing protein [Syntrophobacteraceae bacterium]
MPVIDRRNVLSGIRVAEAMRRQVARVRRGASVEQAARCTIKLKVNAILVHDEGERPAGVVSKTDLMGAYYAGLPLHTPVESIMVAPPLFCRCDDSLENALDAMRTHRVHRLYVLGDGDDEAVGVLAYPDIVGMLYRFCHKCDRSLTRSGRGKDRTDDYLRVGEVMTPSAFSVLEEDSLAVVMEGLSAQRLGAVLIRDVSGFPTGVISKSDLMMAYRHGAPTETLSREIMSRPVRACDQGSDLAGAIRHMIFADVQRIFVFKGDPRNIVGTLSLSDAARLRSGSCRACTSSRIRLEEAAV